MFRSRPDGLERESLDDPRKNMAEREQDARPRRKEKEMRKVFELGGVLAAAVLIAFGIVAIVMGVDGRSTVNSSL